MPKRPEITEDIIRLIVEKYVHPVSSIKGKTSIPDVRKLITDALRGNAPERDVDAVDVASVASKLAKNKTVSNKVINETAKKVVDDSAMKDLKFMIGRNARKLGKKFTDQDVNAIIKQGKLNPNSASLDKIKKAVGSYYETGRPLEHIPPPELRDLIKTEVGKTGPVDDRKISDVLNKYLGTADQDKPFDPAAVQAIINAQLRGLGASTVNPPPVSQAQPLNAPGTPKKGPPKPPGGKPPKPGSWVPPQNPKKPTFFEKIRLKLHRYGIKSLTRGARNWLTDNVANVSRTPSRRRFLNEGQTVADAVIGKMFLYFYDAKTKKELPWDKFPLNIPIALYPDGWLGINFHYLSYPLRIKLFDKLLQFADDKSLDKITKLRLTYGVLKNFSQYPEVKPCLKRYLFDHVKSELLRIEAIDYETAIFLPVELFQKETKETVWKESRKIIKKYK